MNLRVITYITIVEWENQKERMQVYVYISHERQASGKFQNVMEKIS